MALVGSTKKRDHSKESQGSESRDIFKRMHKVLDDELYACDLDFVLIMRHDGRGVIAFIDFKSPREDLTFTERILYNALRIIAPVYIIRSANPVAGPFSIELVDHVDFFKPDGSSIRELHAEMHILRGQESLTWDGLQRWERGLRARYSDLLAKQDPGPSEKTIDDIYPEE